jgi:glycosyltransferase involved in cell wall biosynthesis
LGEYYQHTPGSPWLERWKWRMNRDCFRLARHLVTWSAWTKAGLVSEYEVPEDKITVLAPGTDVQAWSCLEQERRQDGPVRVLFVGGDFKRKGGVVLLEAFRLLRQQVGAKLPVELHLVTREKIPQEPGVFVYNDMRPNSAELKQLYFSSQIFCLPTYGDCLPMVLSEAGAAGLPLVSTCLAAIPEIVRDGETGFLVPPGEAGPLVNVLQRLVEEPDLRLRQGQSASKLVSEFYDARRNTGRLIEILKQAAADNNLSR